MDRGSIGGRILTWLLATKNELMLILTAAAYSLFLHYRLGMDASCDTFNYHFYIGWAAAHLAAFKYGAVAHIHTFFNPWIDVVNQVAFTASPYLGAAFHSLCFTVALFSIYRIALNVLDDLPNHKQLWALVACAIGGTGAMTVSLFGSFTNEHITAMFILLGLLGVLETMRDPDARTRWTLASGVSAGAAVAFKLTALPYAVGLWLALACCSRGSIKRLFVFTAGLASGYFVFEAPFWFLRYFHYGNPMFPFANTVFHSPYYPILNISYSRFEPGKILVYLAQPIRWLYSGDFAEGTAAIVRDGRILLAFVGVFAFGVGRWLRKNERANRAMILLILFFVFSWLIWIGLFRIYRYLVTLELLTGVLLVAGLWRARLISPEIRWKTGAVLAVIVVFLVSTTVYPSWGRRPWQSRFINATFPCAITQGQLVILTDQVLSWMVPQLVKKGARVAALYAQPSLTSPGNGWPTDPQPITLPSPGNILFLQYTCRDPRLDSPDLARLMGDRVFTCKPVQNNLGLAPLLGRFLLVSELPLVKKDRAYRCGDDELMFSSGWSQPYEELRASDGTKASLQFYLSKSDFGQKGAKIHISGLFIGEQAVKLRIAGDVKIDQRFVNQGELVFEIRPEEIDQNGKVDLNFEFPLAKPPGNGDPRSLAFLFKSLKIRGPE